MTETVIPVPPRVAQGEIIRCLVGSTLYGTGLPGVEDTDYMGVCIEPWESIYGLKKFDQWTWRSQPEGVCSGFGDVDITIYGLRKFMSLATKGNPSILLLLFVPPEHLVKQTQYGVELQVLAPDIVSKKVVGPYLGYAQAQLDRLTGARGGRHVNRPELVEQFGYDTKFAMHAMRLALQGAEILHTGRIEVPIPNPEGDVLRAIRQGLLTYDEAVLTIEHAIQRLKKAADRTTLRDEPNYERIQAWMRHARTSPILDRA